jgi:FdhE protein
MAQRVLEPGQIETLAQRSIPRVRLPSRAAIFARRSARLRELAPQSSIGSYLEMLAEITDAQHGAVARLAVSPPARDHIERSHEHGMPPIHAASWPRPPGWHDTLESVCAPLTADARFPAAVGEIVARIRSGTRGWRERQADALLEPGRDGEIDIAAAPFIMAALQVHWVALASRFETDCVRTLDAHGVCPLCGSLPVASIVYAHAQFQGYRYLHCVLCETEWHMVRVQCTRCGATGKDIAYHSLEGISPRDDAGELLTPGVRAETCEHCRGYRKILYEEKDPGVELVADDLDTLALDLLLSEKGYQRANCNPLLWHS